MIDTFLDARLLGLNPLEVIASLLGLVSVGLTVRQNVLCWPIGIVMVALFTIVFARERLYADAGLQVVFLVLQVYGWYEWLHGGKGASELPVTRTTPSTLLGLLVLGAAGTAALGTALARWTNQDLSYLDSAVAVYSLVAQGLLARKKIENWLLWIAIDVLAVGIYAWKHLYATAVLYGIFCFMAAAGYRAWRRSLVPEAA